MLCHLVFCFLSQRKDHATSLLVLLPKFFTVQIQDMVVAISASIIALFVVSCDTLFSGFASLVRSPKRGSMNIHDLCAKWLVGSALLQCAALSAADGLRQPVSYDRVLDTAASGSPATDIRLSPNGGDFAAAALRTVVAVFNSASAKRVATLKEQRCEPQCMEFSPDGNILAVGSDQGTLQLWRTSQWTRQHVLHLRNKKAILRALSFSGDGSTLASVDFRGNGTLWNIALPNPRVIREFRGGGSVALSESGTAMATAYDDWVVDHVVVGRTESRNRFNDFPEMRLGQLGIHFGSSAWISGSGNRIAATWGSQILRWSVDAKPHITRLKQPVGPLSSMRLSRDARTLVTGSTEGKIKIWDTRSGDLVAHVGTMSAPVYSVDVTDDREFVIAGDRNGRIANWQVRRAENP